MNSKMYQDLEKIIGHYGINNQLLFEKVEGDE